jgi:NMD protein affecting ribosome stability and mRNA decay
MDRKPKPFNKNAPVKTPGFHTGSRGKSTNQKPGLYRNSHAGTCQECGLRFPAGNFVSAGRNGGMVHPRCIGKNNASSSGSSTTPKATKKLQSVKKTQQAKLAPVPKSQIKFPAANSKSEVTSRRESKVDKSDLPAEIGQIVASTPCPICQKSKGIVCVASRMMWVHESRLNLFNRKGR